MATNPKMYLSRSYDVHVFAVAPVKRARDRLAACAAAACSPCRAVLQRHAGQGYMEPELSEVTAHGDSVLPVPGQATAAPDS